MGVEGEKICSQCHTVIDGRWTEYFQGDKLVETLCERHARAKMVATYRKTHVITTSLMLEALVSVRVHEVDETQADTVLDEEHVDLFVRFPRIRRVRRVRSTGRCYLLCRDDEVLCDGVFSLPSLKGFVWLAVERESAVDLLLGVQHSVEAIQRILKEVYEPKVWLGYLQGVLEKSAARGHSAEFDSKIGFGRVRLLSYVIAGRAVQTIQMVDEPQYSITLIFDESRKGPSGGIQGIYASEHRAQALMLEVVSALDTLKEGRISLVEDNEVCLA